MTINQAIEFMLKNEKDEKKLKTFEELCVFLVEFGVESGGEKISGRRLFELTENLVKEWPEFVTMLVALSYLAQVGLNNADFDPKEVTNIDLSDFMTED